MSDSQQHILNDDAAPRVQITYDVQKDGAKETKDLPGIVGILADASGQPDQKPLAERRFVNIDGTKLDDTIRTIKPRLAFHVENTLDPDSNTKLPVNLSFQSMDDFTPSEVARQVAPLRELLEIRQQLSQLLEKMTSKTNLPKDLQNLDTRMRDIIEQTQKKLAGESAEGHAKKGAEP